MKLEVGNEYRTRGGRRATITGKDDEYGVFWGYIGSACDMYKEWNLGGKHRYGSTEFDIVSEWRAA